jgi:hypothetical protein
MYLDQIFDRTHDDAEIARGRQPVIAALDESEAHILPF